MVRTRKTSVLALALLLQASFAQAQGDRMKEVKRACAAGDVDRGVRLLADLYTETNDPTAIYNQGRCYQQNARPEMAASRFREYLRQARTISPTERAEVEGFIREADAEAARRAAAPVPVSAPLPVQAAPVPATPPGYLPAATPPGYPPAAYPAPAAPPATLAGKSEPAKPKKGLLIAGTITLGVSYLITALAGAGIMGQNADTPADERSCTKNCRRVGGLMLIPVLGPFLAAPSTETNLRGGVLLLGVTQAVGLTLTIFGYRAYSKSKAQLTAVGLADLRLGVTPLPGGGLSALRATF